MSSYDRHSWQDADFVPFKIGSMKLRTRPYSKLFLNHSEEPILMNGDIFGLALILEYSAVDTLPGYHLFVRTIQFYTEYYHGGKK